jgi:polar amino acid transport system substrate-binding protein
MLTRRTGLAAFAAFGLSCVMVGSDAWAEESTLDVVRKRGTLIVGIKTDYPPYGYIDESGATVGFDIELAKYIAKKLGVGIELRPVTSANRIPMLQSGTVDLLAASLSITRPRAEAVDFSIPYIGIGGRFVVKKGSSIRGYADLAGKTVAVVQGAPSTALIRQQQPKATVITFQQKPQAVQAVLLDKAAAFIDDAGPAFVFTREHPELEAVGEAFEPQTIGLGLRQNDARFRNAVNFAILDMAEDGTYLKLYRQFFQTDPDPTFRIWPWPR